MQVDGWGIIQSFFLPGNRTLLPLLYKHLDNKEITEAGKILARQIIVVEKLRGTQITLSRDFLLEINTFLFNHRASLSGRLETICCRSNE